MKWGPVLYIFFVTTFFSACIPAGIHGYWYFINRKAVVGAEKWMLQHALWYFGVALLFLCDLVANACFGFVGPKPVYTLGFALTYWGARVVVSIVALHSLLSKLKIRKS